jgi:hypothetical protein
VSDTAAILTAIKSMQPMTLTWDETSTTDNQTRQKATWARKGQAYLSDCTFTFDNRTNSTKQLQFSGTGPLEVVPAAEATQVIPLGSYTRGETVRLYLSSNNTDNPTTVLAAARSLSLHVSITLEDATTKDTDGAWVGISDYSFAGLSAEAGVIFKFGPVSLSAGVSNTASKYTAAEVGLGVMF